MAKRRATKKPQLSLDDLKDYAASMMGGSTTPTRNPVAAMGQAVNRGAVQYLDPRDFGKPNRLATDAWDYAQPLPMFSAEETRRLVEQGPDRGHAASVAFLAALLRAKPIFRGVRGLLRAGTNPAKEKGVQPVKPLRQQSAAMGGVSNDPLAQYAALMALVDRR